ncbi:MAG: lipopolysaccharide heptosyltransferase I [Phycisphaerales bacterium]|nr:lipopolysaccharide heptosyltransferase I [Phycisphaerales bacterium]
MNIETPQKILIIRPSALGDVCRTVPVLDALRARFPEAQIDWLVQDSFAGSITHHPALNNVIPFPRKALARQLKKAKVRPLIRWLRTLRAPRYDLVIDAQGLLRSAFFAYISGAKERVGYRNAQELGWIFYTKRIDAPKDAHTVDRMLALAEGIGCDISKPSMRLYTGQDELSEVVIEYPNPYIVLAPTSRWGSKRWPIERFVELAEALAKRGTHRVILVGGPGERLQCAPLVELAREHPHITDRIGSTSITQLMALISRADLVVANDSAALHMGVGFDRQIVALFGPTDASLVGPYRRDDSVIQHLKEGDTLDHKDKANTAIMERITTEEVLTRCLSLIHEKTRV